MVVALPAKPIINDLHKDRTGKTESTGMGKPNDKWWSVADKLVDSTDTDHKSKNKTPSRQILVALPAKPTINDLYKDRIGNMESTGAGKNTDKLVDSTATDHSSNTDTHDADTNTNTDEFDTDMVTDDANADTDTITTHTVTATHMSQKNSQSENSLILGVSNVIRAFFGNATLTGVEPQQQTPRPHKTDQIAKMPARSSPAPNDVKPHFRRKFSGKKRGLGDMAVPLDRVRVISEKPRMLPTIRRVHPGPTMS